MTRRSFYLPLKPPATDAVARRVRADQAAIIQLDESVERLHSALPNVNANRSRDMRPFAYPHRCAIADADAVITRRETAQATAAAADEQRDDHPAEASAIVERQRAVISDLVCDLVFAFVAWTFEIAFFDASGKRVHDATALPLISI